VVEVVAPVVVVVEVLDVPGDVVPGDVVPGDVEAVVCPSSVEPVAVAGGTIVVGRDGSNVVVVSGSGSRRMTGGELVSAPVVSPPKARVDGGIGVDGWMTRLRTCATAVQDRAMAKTAASAQPIANLVPRGMPALWHNVGSKSLPKWLEVRKASHTS
jgi:hypothetical protein